MEDRKFLTKKRVIIALLIYLLSPFWIACLGAFFKNGQWISFKGREIQGMVIEADTSRPIEEAIVVASWSASPIVSANDLPFLLLLALNPLCYLEEKLDLPSKLGAGNTIVCATDKEGKFVIPAWKSFQPWTYMYMTSINPYITIYKPGYKVAYPSTMTWANNRNDNSFCPQQGETKLAKSMTAKEIEEDYDDYRTNGSFSISNKQDWLKAADLIEKALANVPFESRKKIEKYLNSVKKDIRGVNR
jgi:hypothetical protein